MRQSTKHSTAPALTLAALLLPTIPVTAADRTAPPLNVATDGFRFNYIDTPFDEILGRFALMTGRQVVGVMPTNRVTLNCGRERINFDLAFMRLMVISLRLHQFGWLNSRVGSDGGPTIEFSKPPCLFGSGLGCIYLSVDKFAQSVRDGGDFAMLLHDCRHSPPKQIVDQELLPSYVLVAEYPGKPVLSVFAAAGDIRHYSPLLDMLDIALHDDNTTVAEITLQRAEPDTVVEVFQAVFLNPIVYHRLRQERQTEPPGADPDLRIWSDWAHRRVVVAGSAEAVARAQDVAVEMDARSARPMHRFHISPYGATWIMPPADAD